MLKTTTFIAIAALIVAGAMVNGAATQRWTAFETNPEKTAALHALELRFQDWRPELVPNDMPTNERSTATSRQYVSAGSGRSAIVTLISGIPGSVSAHTPDICYPGSGYKTLRAPKKETVALPTGQSADVYVADFEKKTATKHDRVRVRWTWAAAGSWVAPDRPRWQFATQLMKAPVLYKVYVVTGLPEAADARPEDDAVTRAFVAATLVQYGAAIAD
ncbi:MAG TPA: exosortase-associated EpsI family protein [Gemmataceae bacterium]|jgi:hypothetical protein